MAEPEGNGFTKCLQENVWWELKTEHAQKQVFLLRFTDRKTAAQRATL